MTNELRTAIELIRANLPDEAHAIVQKRDDRLSFWIHAWLHRQEGDPGNARYWYARAERPFPTVDLENELDEIDRTVSGNE